MKQIIIFITLALSINLQAKEDCSFQIQQKDLKNYRYVIVPGILNEILAFYMTEHKRFLIQNGVPKNQIHRLNLSSLEKPDDAADVIEQAVSSLPQDKEFVFIAHSKGALETLYFLKSKILEIQLKGALLIQGPLDGASITDLPDEDGFLGSWSHWVKKFQAIPYVYNFDKAYSRVHVRERLADLHGYSELLEKLILVESEVEYDDLKYKFKPLSSQYRKYFGSVGDGVLMNRDHIPSVLKGDSSICRYFYKADHSDLVKAAPWSSLRVDRIHRFMERAFY